MHSSIIHNSTHTHTSFLHCCPNKSLWGGATIKIKWVWENGENRLEGKNDGIGWLWLMDGRGKIGAEMSRGRLAMPSSSSSSLVHPIQSSSLWNITNHPSDAVNLLLLLIFHHFFLLLFNSSFSLKPQEQLHTVIAPAKSGMPTKNAEGAVYVPALRKSVSADATIIISENILLFPCPFQWPLSSAKEGPQVEMPKPELHVRSPPFFVTFIYVLLSHACFYALFYSNTTKFT